MSREREREQAGSETQTRLSERVKRGRRRLRPLFRGVAFWAAILLPWVAIGLLFAGVATDRPGPFTGLVVLNLVSAVIGGKYEHTL